MLSCALIDPQKFPSEILSGPETGAEGSLHEECRQRGVKVSIEPSLVRRVSPWHDAIALFRLAAFMRRGRFDLVHTHSSKAGILGRIAARMAGVPIVVHTAHGWGFTPAQSPPVHALYVWLERYCAGLCQTLIVVSTSNREEGLRRGIARPEQYRLIRSGIEIETYRDATRPRDAVRAELGVPPSAFVITSVGRLGPQKAPLDLLQAFAPVARERTEARLVLVGDGPQRADVEAATKRLGLERQVHLVGLRRDVPDLLHASDVFALASRWEGLPRVFPQAMAAGLPIVATRVDGATDAVVPGESGWLVEPGDTQTLGARLAELARDPAQARRMGECGRARVEEFSARRMVDQLAALYDELATERFGARSD